MNVLRLDGFQQQARRVLANRTGDVRQEGTFELRKATSLTTICEGCTEQFSNDVSRLGMKKAAPQHTRNIDVVRVTANSRGKQLHRPEITNYHHETYKTDTTDNTWKLRRNDRTVTPVTK